MRLVKRYYHTFSHPKLARTLEVAASGCTPCEARGNSWVVLEELKKTDRSLPQDNDWALVGQIVEDLKPFLRG